MKSNDADPFAVPASKQTSKRRGNVGAALYVDTHLDREVVIKKLKPGTDARRILDELAALQAIRSKHVVEIYDVIKTKNGILTAIVEEYLPGGDLTKAFRPQKAEEFLRVAYPIARSIADIHEHGLVHRDIKRQNMKYDAEGVLKIFDFGLARNTAVDPSTAEIIGTPGHMAPELFEEDAEGAISFSTAVDVYAFAATLVAASKGRLPRGLKKVPPDLPCPQADFGTFEFGHPGRDSGTFE